MWSVFQITRAETSMPRHYAHSDDLGGAAGAGIAALAIVILLLVLYLLVKACNLIIRTIATYPKNKPLWIALSIFLVSAVLTALTRGNAVCIILFVLSFLGLLATARIVELYYADLFQEETTLVQNVLRKPWWQGAQQQIGA